MRYSLVSLFALVVAVSIVEPVSAQSVELRIIKEQAGYFGEVIVDAPGATSVHLSMPGDDDYPMDLQSDGTFYSGSGDEPGTLADVIGGIGGTWTFTADKGLTNESAYTFNFNPNAIVEANFLTLPVITDPSDGDTDVPGQFTGTWDWVGGLADMIAMGSYGSVGGNDTEEFVIGSLSDPKQWTSAETYDDGSEVDFWVAYGFFVDTLASDLVGPAGDPFGLTGVSPDAFQISADEITFQINLPGDFNGDGMVEAIDLALLLNNWGESVQPGNWLSNWDGFVDANELSGLLGNWGVGVSGAASLETAAIETYVPEPACVSLIAMGVIALARRRRTCAK